MAIVTTDNQHYTDIAAAIRSKNGTETQYKPSEMAAAIQAISGGEPVPPDDGKTRLYITIPANAMPDRPPPWNQVPLYIQQTVANGVTIDWGDGTAPETLPGTSYVNTTHTYEQAGDYVISLEPMDGCELGFGKYNTHNILGTVLTKGRIYSNMLKKVYIGKGVFKISGYAFAFCECLEKCAMNNLITNIGKQSFYNCTSLKSLPIPNSVKIIDSQALNSCRYLVTLMLPNSIEEIKDTAFSYASNMKEYHFLSVTPPIISSSNIFGDIIPDCVIYVPKGSAEAYKTATNWTTVADKIQEEPA